MIIINDILIADDLVHAQFACNIPACNGACCIEGDYGAPLTQPEVQTYQQNLEILKPFMEPQAIDFVAQNDVYELDFEDEESTQCLPSGACVFVKWNGLQASCAIENAQNQGAISFHKPLSCSLYPIRVKQIGEYTALNLHRWDICSPAFQQGSENNIYVTKFLAQPLTRAFGAAFVHEVEEVLDSLRKSN